MIPENVVALWTVESGLYAKLDASMNKGITQLKMKNVALGAGHSLHLAIISHTGSPITLQQPFDTTDMKLSMHFQCGSIGVYRVDTSRNILHYHLESGTSTFEDHVPITGSLTVAGLISYVFECYTDAVQWKFPNTIIASGSGFIGPS